MRILLTGANGFIGSEVAKKLTAQKNNVRCFVRSSGSLQWLADLKTEIFYGDLFDKVSLKNALKNIDMVFHLAGVTKSSNVQGYERGNYFATKNLLDTIIENNIKLERLLFVGSQAAYGPSTSLEPIDENQFPNPLTFYGKSKLKAQQYVEKFKDKIPTTIVLPSAVYGPRDKDVLEFFKTVKLGIIPQLGGRDKYASMVHVADLADGIIAAAQNKNTIGQKYFLTNPSPCSWGEIARITLNHLGKSAIHVNLPLTLINTIAGVTEVIARIRKKPNILSRQKVIEMKQDFWICSPKKAWQDFGWEAQIDLDTGIKETLGWYVSEGWL
jgi:nucleoside-diphosphate-sugar epimerase